MRLSLSLLLLVACGPGSSTEEKPPEEICGNLADDDLDDLADCVDPDCAALCGEVCTNGVDDDLDGLIDCLDDNCDGLCPENCGDGRDNDGDGAIDCDDRDCFGSCPEVCSDGFDNDGDGKVDCLDEECVDPSCAENCTDGRDNDADGLVDCSDEDCVDPNCAENCTDGRDNDADGRVDCDDVDCDGACPEVCTDGRDNDADGRIDCDDEECAEDCDADGDGFFNADYGGDDCDDSRFDINPSRPEICNGEEVLDDDCDGLFDENDPDVDPLTLIVWGPDNDADGFGVRTDVILACRSPPGFGIVEPSDCDDRNSEVNPLMPEICNPETPLDDDCDGRIDDADPDVTEDSYLEWYADRDGDGFGAEDDFEYACSRPEGTASTNDDCDDADPTVGPPSLWFGDSDSDGFGAAAPISPTPTCEPPAAGLAPDWIGLDCGPDDPTIFPGAVEVCEDGVDQDCDGADSSCGFYVAEGRKGTYGSEFGLVNVETGTYTPINPALDYAMTGMSFGPDGQLYGVEAGGRTNPYLLQIDPMTGAQTVLSESTDSGSFSAFAHGADGGLYGWTESTDDWITIDPFTGSVSVTAVSIGTYNNCMALAPDGLIYMLVGSTAYRLDPASPGAYTSLGLISGLGSSAGGGCTYHRGVLYKACSTGSLYAVDLVSMTATDTGIRLPDGADSLASPDPF